MDQELIYDMRENVWFILNQQSRKYNKIYIPFSKCITKVLTKIWYNKRRNPWLDMI